MSLPLYLLRRPAANVSSALYIQDDRDRSVCFIMPKSDDNSLSHKAVFITVGDEGFLQGGKKLEYADLLELLLKENRVVTL